MENFKALEELKNFEELQLTQAFALTKKTTIY